MFGAIPLAILSNSARVMTVSQLAELFGGSFAAAGDFVPGAAVLVLGAGAGQTPLMVSTGAVGATSGAGAAAGTGAALPAAGAWAAGAAGAGVCAWAPAVAAGGAPHEGAGVPGCACPQARVPSNTHISQLLLITVFLQDWRFRELLPELGILAHRAAEIPSQRGSEGSESGATRFLAVGAFVHKRR